MYGCKDAGLGLPIACDFLAVPDAGLSPATLEARATREAASAQALRENAAAMTTLAEVGLWLHASHRCYSAGRQHEWHTPTEATPEELASY